MFAMLEIRFLIHFLPFSFDSKRQQVSTYYRQKRFRQFPLTGILVVTTICRMATRSIFLNEEYRYFAKEKVHKLIKSSSVVLTYNAQMGGGDFLDSILGYYQIKTRSEKWYLRPFIHTLNLLVAKACLLFVRDKEAKHPLLWFRAGLAKGLCRPN